MELQNTMFVVGGRPWPVSLLPMARRKRWVIQVTAPGRITVRAPANATLQQAIALLHHHQSWLLHHLDHAARAVARPTPAPGSTVAYLGQNLTLQPRSGVPGVGHIQDNTLHLAVASDLPEDLEQALTHWYRLEARRQLPPRLRQWAEGMGVSYTRLTIRGQTSRWGSCSGRGSLNLNWKLLWLSWEVVDYVLVHELCHLRHMNHSADFWAEVGRHLPGYQELRKQLQRTRLKH